MEINNYARRLKRKDGDEKHITLHAANVTKTFCGKELNEMWFIESSAGLDAEDVTCYECQKVLKLANAEYQWREASPGATS